MYEKIKSTIIFCIMCGFTIYVAIIVTDNNNYLTCYNLQPNMKMALTIDILTALLFFNCFVYECYSCFEIFRFLFFVLNCLNFIFFCLGCKALSLLTIKCTNEYNKYHIAIYILFIIHFILSLTLLCVVIYVLISLCCPRKFDTHNTQNTTITTYVTRYDTNDVDKNIDENNTNINANYELEQTIKKPNDIDDIDDINIISDIENNININLQENNKNIKECCICISKYKQKYVLIPCGHTQICFNCYKKLQQKKCPLCNKQIKSIIKIYQ